MQRCGFRSDLRTILSFSPQHGRAMPLKSEGLKGQFEECASARPVSVEAVAAICRKLLALLL